MNGPRRSSPSAARLLLRLCLPQAVADAALGDLEEELDARHSRGAPRIGTHLWYWKEAISLALAYLADRRDCAHHDRQAAHTRRAPRHNMGVAMDSQLQDLRYAVRRLVSSPLFTTLAILLVAVGIAANTAVFSAVHATLLRPPPFDAPERLVHVYQDSLGGEPGSSSFPAYTGMVARTDVFAGAAALYVTTVDAETDAGIRQALVEFTTASYFPVLGLLPHVGRGFVERDNEPAAEAVAVVSHRTWRTRFGADPGIVGRTVRLGGAPVTIVGVGPERYNGTIGGMAADFWLSLSALGPVLGDYAAQTLQRPQDHWFLVRARLREGVTVPQARTAMQAVSDDLAERYAGLDQRRGITVLPLGDVRIHPMVDGAIVPAASLLMGIVGLVLALVCSNLAILLLLRGSAQRREVSIRAAIGAGRGRIVRQFLTESVLLSMAGGVAGCLLAGWLLRSLSVLDVAVIPGTLDLTLNYSVLAFAVGLSLLTGMAFGLAPALRAARVDVMAALRDGGVTVGRNWLTLRNGMVAFQVALSVVLLAATGLFVRSIGELERVDVGFDRERLAFVETSARQAGYEAAQVAGLFTELHARLAALPGVHSVARAAQPPVGGIGTSTLVIDEYVSPAGTNVVEVPWAFVSPEYFDTLRIPIRAGRAFRPQDDRDAPAVAVVSEAMARQYWGTADVVGRRYRHDARPDSWVEIVGVAADVKVRTLDEEPQPLFYRPLDQQGSPVVSFIVRTTGDPRSSVGALGRTVRALDPALPVLRAMTIEDHLAEQLLPARVSTMVLTVFSLAALGLAALGLYAVVAFSAGERASEVGIRMALGARASQVLWTMVRGVLGTVGVGLAAGLLLALAAAQGLEIVLYNVSPADPLTLVTVVLLLGLVAATAACVPARRAARADPMATLRQR